MFKLLLCLFCASAILAENLRDNIDVDKLQKDHGALTEFVNCLTDKGPCSPQYQDFKDNMPHNVQNGCADCSEVTKKVMFQAAKVLLEERPDVFKAMQAKLDPDGQRFAAFEEQMKALNG